MAALETTASSLPLGGCPGGGLGERGGQVSGEGSQGAQS